VPWSSLTDKNQIRHEISHLPFEPPTGDVSPDACELLAGLINRVIHERTGTVGGVNEVRAMEIYREIHIPGTYTYKFDKKELFLN
jgi:hypothetical protein